MGDLRDRVRHDENALQKLADAIPGFAGYHQQEIRRSADKLLRDHLAGQLDQIRQRLFRFQGELRSRGEFKPVTDVDRLGRRLVRARDRVEHAPYGYAGFFDAAKVGVEQLDRLYDYDLAIKENLATIDAAVEAVTQAPLAQYDETLAKLGEAIDELSRMIDRHRGETLGEVLLVAGPEGVEEDDIELGVEPAGLADDALDGGPDLVGLGRLVVGGKVDDDEIDLAYEGEAVR